MAVRRIMQKTAYRTHVPYCRTHLVGGTGVSQSLRKALHILRVIAYGPGGLTIRELAEQTGMTRSSVHRLLAALAEEGFLVQDQDTKEYRLGPEMFALCTVLQQSNPFITLARPVLRRLAAASGETAFLSLYQNGHIVFVDKVESTASVRFSINIGDRAVLHAGSAGKAVMLLLPDDEIERAVLPVLLEAYGPSAGRERFRRLLEEVRECRLLGWTKSVSERVREAAGVSAPVRLGERMIGSLTISFPASRLAEKDLAQYAELVKAGARELSTPRSAAVGDGSRHSGVPDPAPPRGPPRESAPMGVKGHWANSHGVDEEEG